MPAGERTARARTSGERIPLLAGLFAAIVVCIVLVADVRTSILDAVRGYVSGEGLWSKGQKAAVYHLTRYAESRDDADFQRYRSAIEVPLGDRQARLELEKPNPDPAVVREGFLRGRNHPDDVDGMATLFRRFRRVSFMDTAIAIWAEADGLITQLQSAADELRSEIASGHPDGARVDALVGRIAALDARLTPLEDGFSVNLGEGARWAKSALTWATRAAAALLLVIGIFLARRLLRAERRERASAALTRAIVDEALDCVITADRDGRILDFNPAAVCTFGWSRDEVVGRTIAETVVPERLRAAHAEGMRRYLATGSGSFLGRRVETTGLCKDGTEIPVEFALSAIARGSETIFAAHIRDLTESKQAEQAVREAEARQRAEDALHETQRFVQRVADATPHIVYLVDLKERRLVYVNRQVMRVIGEQPAGDASAFAALRERIFEGDLGRLPGIAPGSWFDGVADDQVVETEFRVKDLADEWHWLHSRNIVFARDPDGSARLALGTAQDVTEQKRADDRAREHEAALAHVLRVSTLGEMATGLAHELNQPLAAIVSYARGCARRLRAGKTEPENLLPVIDQISSEALRAGEFIRHLRALVVKEQPPRDAADVNELVTGIARLTGAEARRLQVAVELDLAPEPLPVVCDRIQIEQVLLNLVRNGFDAMADVPPAERVLHIHTAPTGDGGATITVRDRGTGIDPALAERIFEPFFTTKSDGMGMGLAISRSIIAAHHGSLTAERNPDRGTTFRMELPSGQQEESASAEAEARVLRPASA